MITFCARNTLRTAVIMLAMTAGFVGAGSAGGFIFTKGSQTTNPDFRVPWVARASECVGTIKSDDGKHWTVPAHTHFQTAPKAVDLYNQCTGIRLRRLSELDLNKVPVIDAGGEETFTTYLFADNYFELYVNGRLLAVDAVPFTPFNSSVVRFKAKRPFSVAVMGVDWEENLGLGSERNRGVAYHPGEAGFIAVIKDGKGRTVAVTDKSWRAQTFYIAPINDRSCLKMKGSSRDSSACSTQSVEDGRSFSAVHWPIPANWFAPDFDVSGWPQAIVFPMRSLASTTNRRS